MRFESIQGVTIGSQMRILALKWAGGIELELGRGEDQRAVTESGTNKQRRHWMHS